MTAKKVKTADVAVCVYRSGGAKGSCGNMANFDAIGPCPHAAADSARCDFAKIKDGAGALVHMPPPPGTFDRDQAGGVCAMRSEDGKCENPEAAACGKNCRYMAEWAIHCPDRVWEGRAQQAEAEGGAERAELLAVEEAAPVPAGALPDVSPAEGGELCMVDPGLLRVSPYQVRAIRGTPELDAELDSLAESIQANGVVQPLSVRRVAGVAGFEIVAGHRRHAAAVLARVETVPCYVVEASDLQAESALVVENLQRRDLTAIEEADSVSRMAARGMTHAQIAAATGKSVRWVYRRLALARMVPEWREFAGPRGLSAAFLGEIARMPAETQRLLYKEMACDEIAAGDVDDWKCAWLANWGDLGAIQEAVDEATRKLESAAWAEYRPDFCAACVKRSDRQPDLFEPGEAGGDEARCLDPECWKRTMEKWLKCAKETLTGIHGKAEVVPEAMSWRLDRSNQKTPRYSTPAVIEGGHNGGRVIWLADDVKGGAGEDGEPARVQRGPTAAQKQDAALIRQIEAWIAAKESPPACADLDVLAALAVDYGLTTWDYHGPGIPDDTLPHGPRTAGALALFREEGLDAIRLAFWRMLRAPLRRAMQFDTVSNCGVAKKAAVEIGKILGIYPPDGEGEGAAQKGRAKGGRRSAKA